MAENILFASPNRIDAYTDAAGTIHTPTLSGGDWQIALTNLQDSQLATVARSNGLATSKTQFAVDLATERMVKILVVVKHNLSLDAQFRVRAWGESGHTTLLHDTGWLDVWPALFLPEDVEWEDDNWWDGKLSGEDYAGYPKHRRLILDAAVYARYWTWEFSDATNAAGYIDIARIIMAPGFQPSRNVSWGVKLGWETGTKVATSLAGVDYFDRRQPYRVLSISLPHLPVQEAYSRLFEMTRQLGIDGEIFVCLDPGDELNAFRNSFLGRLTKLNPQEFNFLNLAGMAVEIKELL